MSKPLYVFDLDETLISADSAMVWNEFLVEKGIVSQPNFLEEDQRLMKLYAEGKLDMEAYLKFSMSPLINLSTSQVNALVKECVESHILPKQFQQSKALIKQLALDGNDMMIISASVTFLVEAVGFRIGIPTVLGIDLVEKNNRYTSKILGVPSYRTGKVIRLKQWLETQSKQYSEIHFYTDSINDLPLCQYADHVSLVNPCARLKEYDGQPNWTTLHWGIDG